MSVGDEFGRRVSDDELCAEVRQAVEDGDEDALRRLGFGGFGGYVQRLSEIMSDSVTDGLDLSADDFGAIMGEVASPARYAHHLVNEAGTAIQSAKDKPLGIHIKPLEPDFDDDALCGTVGKAASMGTPEQTVVTLADGLGYAVKKAGNDFIKANAEQRSKAGFEVKVKRSGSTKCCPWCAARIGSWALKNAPDGVFGCHANCSCTVEYTSSTGAKTSARGANLHRFGTGAFVEVEYQPPHVMSREEAREKGGFDEPKRLTNVALDDILDNNEGIDSSRFYYDRMTEEQRTEVIKRGIQEDKPVFSHDTANNHAMEYCRKIQQDERFYYIFSHGSVGRIDFFHEDYPVNDPRGHLDPYTLAEIIRGRDDFKEYLNKCSERGITPAIRLLCCHTGEIDKSPDCFGKLFSEEIACDIYAPDDVVFVSPYGLWRIGQMGDGNLIHFRKGEKV